MAIGQDLAGILGDTQLNAAPESRGNEGAPG